MSASVAARSTAPPPSRNPNTNPAAPACANALASRLSLASTSGSAAKPASQRSITIWGRGHSAAIAATVSGEGDNPSAAMSATTSSRSAPPCSAATASRTLSAITSSRDPVMEERL